jgi:hypothetical protein
VGAVIFFREARVAWEELFPFADRRVLEGAKRFTPWARGRKDREPPETFSSGE